MLSVLIVFSQKKITTSFPVRCPVAGTRKGVPDLFRTHELMAETFGGFASGAVTIAAITLNWKLLLSFMHVRIGSNINAHLW